MCVWLAKYNWKGNWGVSQTYNAVVVGDNKEAALGLVLEEYPKTIPASWEIKLIDTSIPKVYPISERSS